MKLRTVEDLCKIMSDQITFEYGREEEDLVDALYEISLQLKERRMDEGSE